jgi:hypothetical protein
MGAWARVDVDLSLDRETGDSAAERPTVGELDIAGFSDGTAAG